MKVQLRETQYELKQTFRSYMIYEQIVGKSFEPKTLSDVIIFFYSTVLASTKLSDLSYDEFIDWIDANPNVVTEFSEWLLSVADANKDVRKKVNDEGETTKK